MYDRTPFFKSFGDVLVDAPPSISQGNTLTVTFVGANPRNDLRLEDTYAAIEILTGSGQWMRVRDDSDWDLIFRWRRINSVLGTSEVDIVWEIGRDIDTGIYRARYWGASKGLGGGIEAFEGTSGEFSVV